MRDKQSLARSPEGLARTLRIIASNIEGSPVFHLSTSKLYWAAELLEEQAARIEELEFEAMGDDL